MPFDERMEEPQGFDECLFLGAFCSSDLLPSLSGLTVGYQGHILYWILAHLEVSNCHLPFVGRLSFTCKNNISSKQKLNFDFLPQKSDFRVSSGQAGGCLGQVGILSRVGVVSTRLSNSALERCPTLVRCPTLERCPTLRWNVVNHARLNVVWLNRRQLCVSYSVQCKLCTSMGAS